MDILIPEQSEQCCASKCDDIFNEYVRKDANLSDLNDPDQARENLDVFSKDDISDRFFDEKNNLSELTTDFRDPDSPTSPVIIATERQLIARNSLNVYSKAEVYNKTETYNKTEVYNKTETYNKTEVWNKAEAYSTEQTNSFFVKQDGTTPFNNMQKMKTPSFTDFNDPRNIVNVGMLNRYIQTTGASTLVAGEGINMTTDPATKITTVSVALGSGTVVTPTLNTTTAFYTKDNVLYGGGTGTVTVDNGTIVVLSGRFIVPNPIGNQVTPNNVTGDWGTFVDLPSGYVSDEKTFTGITKDSLQRVFSVNFEAFTNGLKVDSDGNVYMPSGGSGSTKTSSNTISFADRRYSGYSNTSAITVPIIQNLGSDLATVKQKTINGITNTQPYYVYAYPQSFGRLTTVRIGVEEYVANTVLTETQLTVPNLSDTDILLYVYVNIVPYAFAGSNVTFI